MYHRTQNLETEQSLAKLKYSKNSFAEHIVKYRDIANLTVEVVADLLEHVTIWPDGRFDISLNYSDESANLVQVELNEY